MKINLKLGLPLLAFCMMSSIHFINAQTLYKIYDSKDIDMKLSGTSTLHKWVMNAKTFTGDAEFEFQPNDANQLVAIKSLSFSLIVENLKSNEKGLDNNAYKALKTNQYKDIVYKLTSAKVIPNQEGKTWMKTQGNLSIAGVTKNVEMDVYSVVNKDGTITCSGSYKLNMTDYQVKPPSFMFGAMKTGDAITLDYILVYKKSTLTSN